MRITARVPNRSTLVRQVLLRHESHGVAGTVRRVVALRAQQAASPYLAPWNRLTGFDPAGLDAAFAGHEVVKATLMRITSHAAHAGDYRAFREVVEPTLCVARLDHRFRASGLPGADAHSLVPDLLGYAGRTGTAAEMKTWLGQRLGAPPDEMALGLSGRLADTVSPVNSSPPPGLARHRVHGPSRPGQRWPGAASGALFRSRHVGGRH